MAINGIIDGIKPINNIDTAQLITINHCYSEPTNYANVVPCYDVVTCTFLVRSVVLLAHINIDITV
jgi:hypothetical protein